MITFITENLATILISALLLAVVGRILRDMIKKKKSRKSIGCGCGCSCSGCSGCQSTSNTIKIK